jgi:hypothetical protein
MYYFLSKNVIKIIFVQKYIKIIILLLFTNLFLTSIYQNNKIT